jgi:Leucine-rich repeat (LRR) protein
MPKKSSKEGNAETGFGMFAPARSFFTESRQYFLAVAAAVTAFGGIQIACAKMGLPRWVSWLALVPPVMVFFFNTIPRLWRERGERILVRLSKQDDAATRPTTEPLGGYFLIGPYAEDRRKLFRRADGMHETVLQWTRQSRESVLVLTGNSGTGKSSLLQAFVIPELREGKPPCTVLLVRSFEDPLVELCRRLAEPGVIWTKPPSDLEALGWGDLLSRVVKQLRSKISDARLIVVLDQFEELVILDPADSATRRVAAMCEFLKGLDRKAEYGFTLLLSLRSDYKTFLEPLGVPPLQQNVNWKDVPAFRQGDAAEFLSAPGTGFQMPDKRLQAVLTEAAALDGTRGLIRPIVLNMLGVVLRRIAGGPEAERPTRTLLADDIRQVVNHSVYRETLRPVLLRMLTDADTKRPRTVGELAQETGFDPNIIQGCLLDLELSGYVRPLSRPDEIVKRKWEISHDFVARLLGPILKTPFQTFWQRTVVVLYPVSLTIWVLLLIGAIGWGRGRERQIAEDTLRIKYHFHIEDQGNSPSAKQDDKTFDSSTLALSAPYFSKIPPIKILDLKHCTNLQNVDALKGLTALQELNLDGCYALTNVDALKGLTSLTHLNLSNCFAFRNMDVLKSLTSLQDLNLNGCDVLTNVDFLKGLTSLTHLDLSSCYALTNVDALKGLTSLTHLNLYGCNALTNADVLKGLSSLQDIDLGGCSRLTSVDFVKDLTALQELSLWGCTKFWNVDFLKGLTALTRLDLGACSDVQNVDSLSGLTALRILSLTGTQYLRNADALRGLTSLQDLNLSDSRSLQNVDSLSGLTALQDLNLSGCNALTNVDALKGLNSLTQLYLYNCGNLPKRIWPQIKTALPSAMIQWPDGSIAKP